MNPRRLAGVLLGSVLAAVLLTGGAMAALIVLLHRPEWWSAWGAAMMISLFAAVAGFVPVVPGVFGGAQWAAYGYLAGAVMRCLSAVFGCVAAVVLVRTPALPTVALAAPLYFAQVAVEAIVLARAFWPRV